MKEYNVQKSVEAQRKYCEENKLPHFAPGTGRCYKCNKNIYEATEREQRNWQTKEITGSYMQGISVEQASSELITGCPHCNRSYCD